MAKRVKITREEQRHWKKLLAIVVKRFRPCEDGLKVAKRCRSMRTCIEKFAKKHEGHLGWWLAKCSRELGIPGNFRCGCSLCLPGMTDEDKIAIIRRWAVKELGPVPSPRGTKRA